MLDRHTGTGLIHPFHLSLVLSYYISNPMTGGASKVDVDEILQSGGTLASG